MASKRGRKGAEIRADFGSRLDEVLGLAIEGATDDRVAAVAATWGASADEVARLLTAAHDRLRKVAEGLLEVERGRSVAQLAALFEKAGEVGDLAAALSIRKEWNRVLGLTTGAKPTRKTASIDLLDAEIRRLESNLKVS